MNNPVSQSCTSYIGMRSCGTKTGDSEMTLELSLKLEWLLSDECRGIRLLESINEENPTLWDASK